MSMHEHAWASMSKYEQTWASMLNPLILTGLTSRSPILALHMLIPNHETIYGDKKEQVNTYEQAWVSMSKNAKSADFNRFDIKIPYFGPPHTFWNHETLNGDEKKQVEHLFCRNIDGISLQASAV